MFIWFIDFQVFMFRLVSNLSIGWRIKESSDLELVETTIVLDFQKMQRKNRKIEALLLA